MNWNDVIKQLIREHMAEHGLSQAELSAKLGKGRSYIPNCLDSTDFAGLGDRSVVCLLPGFSFDDTYFCF